MRIFISKSTIESNTACRDSTCGDSNWWKRLVVSKSIVLSSFGQSRITDISSSTCFLPSFACLRFRYILFAPFIPTSSFTQFHLSVNHNHNFLALIPLIREHNMFSSSVPVYQSSRYSLLSYPCHLPHNSSIFSLVYLYIYFHPRSYVMFFSSHNILPSTNMLIPR